MSSNDLESLKQFELDAAAWALRYRQRLASRLETPLDTEDGAWLRDYPLPMEFDLDGDLTRSPEDAADDEMECWDNDGAE